MKDNRQRERDSDLRIPRVQYSSSMPHYTHYIIYNILYIHNYVISKTKLRNDAAVAPIFMRYT